GVEHRSPGGRVAREVDGPAAIPFAARGDGCFASGAGRTVGSRGLFVAIQPAVRVGMHPPALAGADRFAVRRGDKLARAFRAGQRWRHGPRGRDGRRVPGGSGTLGFERLVVDWGEAVAGGMRAEAKKREPLQRRDAETQRKRRALCHWWNVLGETRSEERRVGKECRSRWS